MARGDLTRGRLDAEAIARLRELDPGGQGLLLQRVFAAFEKSLSRLMPQIEHARDTADGAGIRLVAHTLKSSSATVGALGLSRVCAEIEALARDQQVPEAIARIAEMQLEVEAVREALRDVCAAAVPGAGAA
jgi:HPt (histidine-containing phosphotransfer) domain-containing protein